MGLKTSPGESRETIERTLCQLLEAWCAHQELEFLSADDLERVLVAQRDRMWKNHEDTDTIDSQIEWLGHFCDLWDASEPCFGVSPL